MAGRDRYTMHARGFPLSWPAGMRSLSVVPHWIFISQPLSLARVDNRGFEGFRKPREASVEIWRDSGGSLGDIKIRWWRAWWGIRNRQRSYCYTERVRNDWSVCVLWMWWPGTTTALLEWNILPYHTDV